MPRERVRIEPPKNFRILASSIDIGELDQVTEFEYKFTTTQKADLASLIDGVNEWLKSRQQVLVNLFETETLHRYTIITEPILPLPTPPLGNKMSENESEAVVETEFKVTDLFRLYKAANSLVHAEETPDLEAKVKFITNTGDEFLVTTLKMEVSEDTEETIVWLEGVIDE